MRSKNLVVSNLNKTWIFDLDGTIVKHNGYKIDGHDTLLEGAKEFIQNIPGDDMIILITSRKNEYRDDTIKFLSENGIRYNHIIFEAPYGERIVMNDAKPSGMMTAYAINTERNKFYKGKIIIDNDI